jgi:putative membrane protein
MAIHTINITNLTSLLVMGLVLLAVNLLIKPLLIIITIPLTILTLGLFTFVINAWAIMIADRLVTGLFMGGFVNCLLAAVIISFFNHLLTDINKK